MDVLYFDCLAGISGDMTIGALLDLGVEEDKLMSELNKIELDGYQLKISKAQKSGITGTDFQVQIENNHSHKAESSDHAGEDSHDHSHGDSHDHDHTHDHDHNHHNHDDHEHNHSPESQEEHSHDHGDHEHRNLHDIKHLINDSNLADGVKELSLNMFQLVAEAEAKVHDKDISEVHFHEVGAVDSIVDIVGVAICIRELDVDKVYASNLHIGTGFVECAHGTIPVPAPATTEILTDVPVYSKGVEGELVTPTGAAIIKTLADEFGPVPEMTIDRTGYGLGDKDLGITNLLRVYRGKKKVNRL
ncbi:LarC family nickel insertion protein [Halanaerobacter jeridensis]|uniref:Uncharacterized protein (DUF111 family) n=1 Tax=Halanaerobacter jeridensis TaxID=706427 RepID=A0A939BQ34_9FIRM|nr:LarC family nickel insertion protein [Halanaerobacter jeridensis]MBM7557633.1 uncharacterized protein (DUF111 family) [Halanaerobacter jeridensis]